MADQITPRTTYEALAGLAVSVAYRANVKDVGWGLMLEAEDGRRFLVDIFEDRDSHAFPVNFAVYEVSPEDIVETDE